MNDLLAWIQASTLGHAISKSNHLLIAAFQVVHVIGFVLLLSSLVLICLRLLGVTLTAHRVALLLQRVAARESANRILARVSVCLALILWFGVSLAGRAIGFV